jgi:hypothetical protein
MLLQGGVKMGVCVFGVRPTFRERNPFAEE